MKVLKGVYIKEDSAKERSIYVLNNSDSIIGLDLTALTEDEINSLKLIVDSYNESLKPFVKKAFRNFKKANFESLNEVIV
jgi:hypothetical protein